MRVGHISGSKHSGNFRTRTGTICNDITHFIRIQIILEYIRIRLMTDSQKETVDRQAVTFLIRFTPTFHKVYTFHSIVTVQTDSIVFKKKFNLLVIHHALLHNLRCTQERLTDNQIYFRCKSGKINRFFTSRITATDYGNHFLTIEETIAGSTSADTHSRIFLFVFQSQILSCCPGRDNQRLRFDFFFSVNRYFIRSLAQIRCSSNTETYICPKAARLCTQIFHQLRSADTFRITGEVFNIRSCRQLTAGLQSFIKHRTQVCTSRINRCRISGRS